MRRIILSLFLCSISWLTAAKPLKPKLDDCVAQQTKLAAFNGVIAARKGDTRYFYQNGFADTEGTRSLTRDTPFRLASVGKLFTQVAVGKLLQDGKIKLNHSVRSYLPELPESFAPITIAHLLQHRSGVAPMTRPDMADAPVMASAQSARDLVEMIADKPLSFATGNQEEYSNGGYLLLGAMIESVSGESYREFIARHIFKPLAMKFSSFEPIAQAAVPLTRMTGPGQPPAKTPQPRMEFPEFKASSAGDALSSASDMESFAAALVADTFLTASVKAAIFPKTSTPWRLGQAGGSVGSNTGFWVFPNAKIWLVVLSNFDPPAGELMGQALLPVLEGAACKVAQPNNMRMQMGAPPTKQ